MYEDSELLKMVNRGDITADDALRIALDEAEDCKGTVSKAFFEELNQVGLDKKMVAAWEEYEGDSDYSNILAMEDELRDE